MSEQEFPNEIPESYREQYDVESLADTDVPIDDSMQKDTRAFAEASVKAVHSLIFPAHGMRAV